MFDWLSKKNENNKKDGYAILKDMVNKYIEVDKYKLLRIFHGDYGTWYDASPNHIISENEKNYLVSIQHMDTNDMIICIAKINKEPDLNGHYKIIKFLNDDEKYCFVNKHYHEVVNSILQIRDQMDKKLFELNKTNLYYTNCLEELSKKVYRP